MLKGHSWESGQRFRAPQILGTLEKGNYKRDLGSQKTIAYVLGLDFEKGIDVELWRERYGMVRTAFSINSETMGTLTG
jgi:hypothetical protein